MDSLDDNSCWDLIDYTTLIDNVASTDFDWISQRQVCFDPGKILACGFLTTGTTVWLAIRAVPEFDYSLTSGAISLGKECSRKRGRNESCSRIGTKACRERQRRERLNDRFLELSSTLEPGRPATTDKSAILGDAIRVLNQLKTESQEYKEMNERLQEEIRSLKAEKNELRKEKLALKADKTRMEQQMKTVRVSPAGFMPAHPAAAYQAGPNNMPVFPSYSFVPMWHYLPPSVRDTSHDHELRPPAA